MAKKNNIRSIRFSDELAELIDRQTGSSFTEKFENLISRCVWEIPAKEEELKRLDRQIQEKQDKLRVLSAKVYQTGQLINRMSVKAIELSTLMEEALKENSNTGGRSDRR